MRHITDLREPMTVEQLSNIVRDYEEPLHKQKHLFGGIITCPLCGSRAVIIAPDMPLEDDVPCHCIVGPYSGKIYGHYCTKDKSAIDLINKVGLFIHLNELDISERFKWFTENSHRF